MPTATPLEAVPVGLGVSIFGASRPSGASPRPSSVNHTSRTFPSASTVATPMPHAASVRNSLTPEAYRRGGYRLRM